MLSNNLLIAPVAGSERIQIIDCLRGIAIMGILLMNIPGFALPDPAYGDPWLSGEYGTINFSVWFYVDWLFEGTQRGFFSILFGAGLIIFSERIARKTTGTEPADYYFRRMLWLLLFGLFNAFVLLWFWDILFHYAISGMLLFVFRGWKLKALLAAAFVCLVLGTVRENVDWYRDKQVVQKGEAIAKIDTVKTKLTAEQQEWLGRYNDMKESSTFDARKKKMEASLRKVRGDYATFYRYQSGRSTDTEIFLTYYYIWDLLLMMFLGMAFYKMGILSGKASSWTYGIMFIGGMGIGLVLSYYRLQPMVVNKFSFIDMVKSVPYQYYEWSRLFRTLGCFGFVMLLYQSGIFKWLFKLLQPVGQMAFTNYLTQSLFVGLFFYGIGLGKFGHLQRYEIYFVVAVVWLVQIIWSNIWLHYFRFGPLEWLWRSLTYWHKPSIKKSKALT